MLTDELTLFMGRKEQMLFQYSCIKLYDNVMTNEWKQFQEEDKRRKKKKEGTANA